MGERVKHPSKIHEKHPNSKFCPGSRAYKDRQEKLAKIVARLGERKSFADVQAGA